MVSCHAQVYGGAVELLEGNAAAKMPVGFHVSTIKVV